MPEHALFLVLLGLVAGLLSGMFGIGGGIVIVPALTLFLSFELQEAIGTSLAVLVMPVSVFAVISYYRAKLLQLSSAAWIAFGLIFGALVGAQLALNLPTETLQRLYGIFLIYVGWRFLEPRKLYAMYYHRLLSSPVAEKEVEFAWYVVLGVGLLAGVASGLFGIGGGLVIVPALVELLNYDQKRAVGTSLAALLPPVSLGAVLSYYEADKIEISSVAFIAAGLILGAFGGAQIALGLPSSTVKRLYGIFLLTISLRFLL